MEHSHYVMYIACNNCLANLNCLLINSQKLTILSLSPSFSPSPPISPSLTLLPSLYILLPLFPSFPLCSVTSLPQTLYCMWWQLTQCEEMSLFVIKEIFALIWLLRVLLFHLSCYRVFESDDEMNFGTHSTFVGTKHDGVRSLVIKFWLERRRNVTCMKNNTIILPSHDMHCTCPPTPKHQRVTM